MTTIPSELWPVVGGCLILAGLWLAVLGRIRRKHHGGRACRRCRYDMAGLASPTCPECGHTAAKERELATRRSLKRLRLTGVLLFILGILTADTPGLIKRGPVSLVPGFVLIRWGPVAASGPTRAARTTTAGVRVLVQRSIRVPVVASTMKTPIYGADRTLTQRVQDALYDDLQRRLLDHEIPDTLAVRYLCRVYRLDPADLPSSVITPKAWPRGQEFSFWHNEPNPNDSPFLITCFTFLRGTMGRNGTTVYVDVSSNVGGRQLTLVQLDRPIDTTRSAAEFMRPLDDRETDDAVAKALNPRLAIVGRDAKVSFDERTDSAAWRAAPCFVAFTFRVLLNGEVVGRGQSFASRRAAQGPFRLPPTVEWIGDGEERVAAHPEAVEIDLSGTPEVAVNEYCFSAWMFDPVAWAGHSHVKPKIEHP